MGSMPGRMNVFALVDGAAGTKSKDGHIAKSDGWSGGTRLMWIQKDPANSKKIVSREVQVDPLISGTYPLSQLNVAFDRLMGGDGIKFLITPEGLA